MIRELANHLWQSTLFAGGAAALAWGFRKNRASVRYWMWFAASAKFLVPFALLISLGSLVEPKPTPRKLQVVAPPSITYSVVEIAPEALPRVPSRPHVIDWPSIALGVWACGTLVLLLMRVDGWRRIRLALASSAPFDLPGASGEMEIREAPGRLEPGVVGVFRSVLLLPVGIADRLTPHQLDAVLAHELSHVRRRDNLLAAVHMAVEAIFWFHPMIWWIGARLVEERELACDEAVLTTGSDPAIYAEGILNVCKMYVESPLACVSGISGADLKRRIHAILSGDVSRGLSRARKIALACAAAAAVAGPVVIGVANAPWIRAQSAAASRPQFEVASIRACDGPGGARGGGGGAKGARGGVPGAEHPGALYLPCLPLGPLIHDAYVLYADGKRQEMSPGPRVEGMPEWTRTAWFSIEAKAPDGTPAMMMRGPMMQALLEDRFKMKIHRETREMAVLELVVAKGGPKLTPTPDGGCTPRDPSVISQRREGDKFLCETVGGMAGSDFRTMMGHGATMAQFAVLLSNIADRPVIDKTSITGMFEFDVRLNADPADDSSGPPADVNGRTSPDPRFRPSSAFASALPAALAQLGLKLQPGKGGVEYLVIDHLEKPSEN